MQSNQARRLLVVSLLFVITASAARAQCCRNYEEFAAQCRSQGGIPSPNPARCEAPAPSGGSRNDTRASDDARAREEAATREREEAERVERERVAEEKRKKDKEESDAKFARDRDEAARTLKGSSGTATPNDFGLKGSGGDTDLRDAVADPGLKGSTKATPDPSKQATAWRQVHCAASIFKYALNALTTKGDYDEYGTLSVEAMKALDGKPIDVQCEAAPNVPTVGGGEVDVEKLQAAEKKLIERGDALASRMKATAVPAQAPKAAEPAPTQQPCTGTKTERMKCTQSRLNDVNSKKILGQTTAAISDEEKNRQELGKLVLINSGLEKGDLSVIVNTSEEATPAPRRHRPGKPVPTP